MLCPNLNILQLVVLYTLKIIQVNMGCFIPLCGIILFYDDFLLKLSTFVSSIVEYTLNFFILKLQFICKLVKKYLCKMYKLDLLDFIVFFHKFLFH